MLPRVLEINREYVAMMKLFPNQGLSPKDYGIMLQTKKGRYEKRRGRQ